MTFRKLPATSLVFAWAVLLALSACKRDAGSQDLADASYREPHRPQFHFTPPSMWMNDPNGLVYYDGEYHLFYQYFPDDKVWGPMHWGHAVSRDLVHWENLPVALYPDEHGYIFSGSAVVDWNNSSGFGVDGEPPLVAIFTYHDAERGKAGTNDHETQGLAYSTDRGRTWTKYANNPVLTNVDKQKDFRDPNVFWHQPSARWIMALSVFDHVQFWASPDLKDWQYLSAFGAEWGAHGGTWECPDLFPLRVAGSNETKWVLILNLNPGGPQGGSGTQYFVGDFDGRAFTLDERFAATLQQDDAVWLDWGRDNYAGITWSDTPDHGAQRVFIGWMSNWDYAQQVPTSPWRSAMTLPRKLTLVDTVRGYRLFSQPVSGYETLRMESAELPSGEIRGELDIDATVHLPPSQMDIELEFDLRGTDASAISLVLGNAFGETYRLSYDIDEQHFVSDRRAAGKAEFSAVFADRVHVAPRLSDSTTLAMRIVLDVASIELFADGGGTVLTDTFFPSQPFDSMSLHVANGKVQLVSASFHRLRSIW